MSEVKWIKITTNMFEDEKIDFIESLPEADSILIIWVKLLTQAGKTNTNGFIYLTEQIPYTTEMLSHKFRRPFNIVKLALETLKRLEMIEFDDEGFLRISNWEKHQNVEGLEKIREQNRIRQARYRAKQKELTEGNKGDNVTVTLCNGTELEEELELELDKEEDKELLEEGAEKKDSSSSGSKYKEIVDIYQNNGFGMITLQSKESIVELIEEYTEDWLIDALKISIDANKRRLDYVRGILKRWKAEGKGGYENGGHKKNDTEDEYEGLGLTFEDLQEL